MWVPLLLTLAALQSSQPAEATAAEHMWASFPAIVWRQDHSGREAPAWVRAFGGVNVVREESAEWVLEAGLAFYVDHAAGREVLHPERTPQWEERHASWFETRDVRFLERDPCLSAPATRAACFAQLERTLSARAGAHGLGVSLGDEVSLTPWGGPEDICLSPTCRVAWRAFLERERGAGHTDIASDCDPALFSTDAARLALADGRTRELEGWFLRRRFHQEVVLELLRELAETVRERAPGTGVGLLGINGQTAFGGVAIERALEFLDFAEAYRTSDARQLIASLRAPRQRVLQTVFATDARPADIAWYSWESWMRGADGFVVWSDRELARSAPVRERLESTLADVRRLHAELGDFRPAPEGVALVHSADAIALNWLRDALLDGPTWPRRFQGHQEQHGSLERDLRGWWRLLEDCGAQPGALPIDAIEASTCERFPLLVLNHLAVVERAGLARLEAFLQAGGTLVVHGPFAELDRRGEPWTDDVLARWRKEFSGRVHVSQAELADYASLRAAGPRPDREHRLVAATRLDMKARLDEAGVQRAPWRVRTRDATLPWLHAWQARAGGWLCASLPNLVLSDERHAPDPSDPSRPRLDDLELRIQAPEGWRVEWLHPAGDGPERRLPAGDAVVFRLRAEPR